MKDIVIYWSGSGNTEMMAEYIASGMGTDAVEVSNAPTDLTEFEHIAFGCPAMGAEELEESVFEPYFASVEQQLKGKKVALFGSYGWGDGEWMQTWQERVATDGAMLFSSGLIACGEGDEAECNTFGTDFLAF